MNPIERFFNVFYGYISFAIPITVGISALISRGTREILFIFSIAFCVSMNEYGLKNIILEPKPLGACAITCGMPSGHAGTTIQYYVLLMVDYAFRINSAIRKDVIDSVSTSDAFPLRVFKLMSNSNVEVISLYEFLALSLIWGCLLVPVPFSRVMNLDHTVEQVLVGSALGTACGLATYSIYYILGKTVCRSAWQWPHEKNWYVIKNTIAPVGGAWQASSAEPVKCKTVDGLKNAIAPIGAGVAPSSQIVGGKMEECV
jgi:hypothetical protein